MNTTVLMFKMAAWIRYTVLRLSHHPAGAAFPSALASRPEFEAVLTSADAYEKPEFV